ncbi:MAG: A24 family peptidase C-terminal domain-containing protein [Methanobacterium sp.]|nr:A24 family peptidase C-terminal domain-containing protein [Methanobacterium sp.]
MLTTIPFICLIIAIITCIYVSYTDFKEGIIQNKITFPLIAIGILLNGIYFFMISNFLLFIKCEIVTIIIFILGYIFWKMGAWAGGDVKLFTGLAALIPFYAIPFYPTLISYNLFGIQFPLFGTYPFPFTLIINSILSVLPFLLIYMIYIVIRTKPYLINELISPIKEYKKNILFTMTILSAVTITFIITKQFDLHIIFVTLILISLISLIISKIPNILKTILIFSVTVYMLITDVYILFTGIIFIYISIIVVDIIKNLLTSISKEVLQDNYKIEDLKAGMIPAYNIYEQYGKIIIADKTFTNRLTDMLKTGDISHIYPIQGRLIISSMAAGLNTEDIKLLNELYIQNKISDNIRIKKGIPFAPSILIGLLLSIFIGDLAFILGNIIAAII